LKFFEYILFRALVLKLRFIPFFLLTPLCYWLAFILQFILRYRNDIIIKNLAFCFPNKSKAELKDLRRQYYFRMASLILESLKAYGMSGPELKSRYVLRYSKEVEEVLEKEGDLIMLCSHFNNWEWAGRALGIQLKKRLIGFAKPLSNAYIDSYIKHKRLGQNSDLIYKLKELSEPKMSSKSGRVISFLADQYPGVHDKRHTVVFFNKGINFHAGPSKFAYISKLPCLFASIKRNGDHSYIFELEILSAENHDSSIELSQVYANKLQELIESDPACWLWSHRRFKDQGIYV